MKKLRLKEFEVKDARVIAKFLVKTGLKQTLFAIMFPQANPHLPKNWIELRAHLQEVHGMTDAEFKEMQSVIGGNLNVALARYAGDFPQDENDMGKKIVEVVIEIFADDMKYEETVSLFAHLYSVDKAIIEAMQVPEVVALVKDLMADSGFFESQQPSTPQTLVEGEVQV